MHQEGYYTGGPVAYGYRLAYTGRRNKKGKPVQDLLVCDEEAAIVKEILLGPFPNKLAPRLSPTI